MRIKVIFFFSFIFIINELTYTASAQNLKISENRRYLETKNGDPFFWLGDTGWLLFTKLNREEAEKYFNDRHKKGFNVIQVMVLHNVLNAVNIYGDSAIINHRVDQPLLTPGSSPDNPEEYDFWDNVDYLVDLARQKGLCLALVPVWGSNIRSGKVTKEQAVKYTAWLAERYKNKPNIIWLNGGDIRGDESTDIWRDMGSTIHSICPDQLISFHPFGRTQSSTWFHNDEWLSFNMFQSGHRRYDQDTTGLKYGEDNWKYVVDDYNRTPVKPTLDGEPSYEGIPQGLHDPSQPLWNDNDVRRYAYWSVFAGGCGFTYGNNAIMQFHKIGDRDASYGVKITWDAALNAPGAGQMKYLKQLMLSRPYFERIPAQDILSGEKGKMYDHLAATRGKDYAFVYTYNGRNISLNINNLHWKRFKSSWFNPRNGEITESATYTAKGVKEFDPPGEKTDGKDWVLILDKI